MRRPELRHAQDASPHTDHASPATPRLIGGSGFRVTAELVEAGLWGLGETGFQIVAWSETQTTRTEMERTRKQNAERQRRHRAAKRG